MDRLTRHELKQDEFREGIDQLEQYLKTNLKQILTVAIVVIAVVGLAVGLKFYIAQQEANANADLASALTTFHAYVGTTPNALDAETPAFPTAANKYQKALGEFNAIVLKYRCIRGRRPRSSQFIMSESANHSWAIRRLRFVASNSPVARGTRGLPLWLDMHWQTSILELVRHRML